MNITKFTQKSVEIINNLEKIAYDYDHQEITQEHLLYSMLTTEDSLISRLFEKMEIDPAVFLAQVEGLLNKRPKVQGGNKYISEDLNKVLVYAENEAKAMGDEYVSVEHLFLSLLKHPNAEIKKLFAEYGLTRERFLQALSTVRGNQRVTSDNPEATYDTLEKYGQDLVERARSQKLDPVIGRKAEIHRLMQVLGRRTKNNPCLVGEPGVGKTAIVEGLAQRIVTGMVPDTVKNKRVVVLDLSGMVAGSKYRGEFEERIRNVIDEVSEQQGILLFIDEIHTIIGAGGAEGALDASNILKPSLSRGEIQLIGATTLEEYRKYIEKDAALERRFQPIIVEEPTEEEAVEILKGLRPYYEKHHDVEILDEALEAAVKMSVRYINDRFLPDKAIDIIDEAASKVQLAGYRPSPKAEALEREIHDILKQKEQAVINADLEGAKAAQAKQNEAEAELEKIRRKAERKNRKNPLTVDEEAVAGIVSDWTKIPVQRLTEGESRRLANLEKVLKKRVIGQDEAVSAVARAVKRGRVGLKDPARPIGSFLFLGPTGVGKTELSKALAEAVFGSEQAMIRVDMSEYMEKHSVSKMIGSPPGYVGYEEGGQLSEKVRRNPYSVILFDEIEKAHPDVFNILLQVLDDGHITDAQGRKVDFKQTIIIMTSNAGAQMIMEPKHLGFMSGDTEKRDYERMKSGVMEEVRRMFKPEFLNRIDEIMVFHSLNKENIRKIVTILLKNLEKRCQEQLDIILKVTGAAKDLIADAGFDSKYGARPLRRAIQTKIEDEMATEILEGRIKAGDAVQVKVKDKKICFEVKDAEKA